MAVKKRFYYKVYSQQLAYITTWSTDVISDPTFRTVINGGAGELTVRLARPYNKYGEGADVTLLNRVELWVADNDNIVNNTSNTLFDVAQWDVDQFDNPLQSFVKLYTGFISQYIPTIDGEQQYIDVTILGFVAETSWRILKDTSGNTTVTYTSKDPSTILTDVIDKYRSDGGVNINYAGGSIQTTGVAMTYTFNNNTLADVFNKIVEFAPEGWYWYLDPNGNVFLRQPSITADHTLTIGKDIGYLTFIKRAENITNTVYVIGGGTPNLFNSYTRQSSVNTYGKFERIINDSVLTDNATADLLAKRELDQYQAPETRAVIYVTDNNGENSLQGQNIEAFKIGDTIQIKNINYNAAGITYWDVAQWDVDVFDSTFQYVVAAILVIVSIVYYPDHIEIEVASRLPEVTKRIENIAHTLTTQAQKNLPAAPTPRAV